MSSAQAALQQATDDAQREAVRADLVQAVADLTEAPPPPEPAPTPAPVTHTPTAQAGTGLEDDAEMREIFVDEAREVLQGAREAMQRLDEQPRGPG